MMWLFLLFISSVGVLRIAYSRSAAARSQVLAKNACEALICLVKDATEQQSFAVAALKKVAADYARSIRLARLKAISIDAVKPLAPGSRMQALYDYGVRTLADVEGWTVWRLTQVRGVGEKSAYLIASAIDKLCQQSNSQPLPAPNANRSTKSEQDLLVAAHFALWVDAAFPQKISAIQPHIDAYSSACGRVLRRTAFSHWMLGYVGSHVATEGVAEAQALHAALSGAGELAVLRKDFMSSLGEANRMRANIEAFADAARDYAQSQARYMDIFKQYIGDVYTPNADKPEEPLNAESVSAEPCDPPRAQPVSVVQAAVPPPPSLQAIIPPPPPEIRFAAADTASSKTWRWLHAGETIVVQGFELNNGMIYVGRDLAAVNGSGVEAALIDPLLRVTYSAANCHMRDMPYWPKYAEVSSGARASYLQWLATGCCDPQADVGYVFLYFYGLERRALCDALTDAGARAELPAIQQEVQRLLSIYGRSWSLQSYARSLMDCIWLAQKYGGSAVQEESLMSQLPDDDSMSMAFRLGIGAFAKRGVPLPSEWAKAWYMRALSPRQPVRRCPEEFSQAFRAGYAKRFGEGLRLPVNKTLIKFGHRPASPSFMGIEVQNTFSLPDVSVLSGPINKIREIAESASDSIASYSRYLSGHPGSERTLDALLTLPIELWPADLREPFEEGRTAMVISGMPKVLPLRDVLSILPASEELNRTRFRAFSRALSNLGLGVEPDVRFGGELLKPESLIVLFAADGLQDDSALSGGYWTASILLQMSAVLAAADNDFSESEAAVILQSIERNTDVSVTERLRLAARMHLYRNAPPGINGLKKSLQPLPLDVKQGIAEFLLTVAMADGVIDPVEVKVLERFYQLLDLDAKTLYSRLHSMESGDRREKTEAATASDVRLAAKAPTGIQFDESRIAALREESAKVSQLLNAVFAEDEPTTVEPLPIIEEVDVTESPLAGLDREHSELLKALLNRDRWSREEFEELCSDRGLMADGALERINEASFDQFDAALLEGDDPIEIQKELMQEVMA